MRTADKEADDVGSAHALAFGELAQHLSLVVRDSDVQVARALSLYHIHAIVTPLSLRVNGASR